MKPLLVLITSLGVFFSLLCIRPNYAWAQLPPLIPVKVLFGNPARTLPQISPDGKRLAFMAQGDKGVLHVFVQALGQNDARQVTHDLQREVRAYQWAADSQHLLYEQDSAGDENYHIFSLDLQSGQIRDLTPFLGIKAQNLVTSSRHPDEGESVPQRRIDLFFV